MKTEKDLRKKTVEGVCTGTEVEVGGGGCNRWGTKGSRRGPGQCGFQRKSPLEQMSLGGLAGSRAQPVLRHICISAASRRLV